MVPYQYSADLTSNTKLAGQEACPESNRTRTMHHDDVHHDDDVHLAHMHVCNHARAMPKSCDESHNDAPHARRRAGASCARRPRSRVAFGDEGQVDAPTRDP